MSEVTLRRAVRDGCADVADLRGGSSMAWWRDEFHASLTHVVANAHSTRSRPWAGQRRRSAFRWRMGACKDSIPVSRAGSLTRLSCEVSRRLGYASQQSFLHLARDARITDGLVGLSPNTPRARLGGLSEAALGWAGSGAGIP